MARGDQRERDRAKKQARLAKESAGKKVQLTTIDCLGKRGRCRCMFYVLKVVAIQYMLSGRGVGSRYQLTNIHGCATRHIRQYVADKQLTIHNNNNNNMQQRFTSLYTTILQLGVNPRSNCSHFHKLQ